MQILNSVDIRYKFEKINSRNVNLDIFPMLINSLISKEYLQSKVTLKKTIAKGISCT